MKFQTGQLLATPGVLEAVPSHELSCGLQRHMRGDWGDICQEDKHHNNQALIDGERLLSVYHTPDGVKFWIITEADRSATTVLLPEEY